MVSAADDKPASSAFSELHEFDDGTGDVPGEDLDVGPQLKLARVPAPVAQDQDEDSDDSSSSSGSSGRLSSDDSDVAEPPQRVKRFRARIPAEEKWYVHSRSHLVHRYEGDSHNDIRFLVCGKRLTEAYALCTEASAWNVLCRSCNRR